MSGIETLNVCLARAPSRSSPEPLVSFPGPYRADDRRISANIRTPDKATEDCQSVPKKLLHNCHAESSRPDPFSISPRNARRSLNRFVQPCVPLKKNNTRS
ncbi:hypothetical protein VTH06DRAFT_1648 [Thermothelomyces fergusii]